MKWTQLEDRILSDLISNTNGVFKWAQLARDLFERVDKIAE